VGEKVGLEVGALVERAIAHRTFVGRLLHVKDLVNCESPRLTETFTTLGTFKWFFLAVDIPVVSEMVLSSEGFPADVARVRPFIRVSPLVDQQIVAFGELSVAVLADELFLWFKLAGD
jgi:hypothetical protein